LFSCPIHSHLFLLPAYILTTVPLSNPTTISLTCPISLPPFSLNYHPHRFLVVVDKSEQCGGQISVVSAVVRTTMQQWWWRNKKDASWWWEQKK
jgi:hypothetical protein